MSKWLLSIFGIGVFAYAIWAINKHERRKSDCEDE